VDGGIPEALEGAEILVAASRPGPGVIKKEWVARMERDAIVFAEANPVPEIWPWEAREAGARVVGTGRSDFPNQVNNSLAFPPIFRGVLDVRARTITDEMAIAAAEELARYAREKGLREDRILPTMEDFDVFPRVAAATAAKAVEQGVARLRKTYQEELETATRIIRSTLEKYRALLEAGLIKRLPPDVEKVIHGLARRSEEARE
jgi:malate dehydrogenase (oxaloacetate-decarboxylating)